MSHRFDGPITTILGFSLFLTKALESFVQAIGFLAVVVGITITCIRFYWEYGDRKRAALRNEAGIRFGWAGEERDEQRLKSEDDHHRGRTKD
jgi:hypothetical protein